jgi:hypothetical protein
LSVDGEQQASKAALVAQEQVIYVENKILK